MILLTTYHVVLLIPEQSKSSQTILTDQEGDTTKDIAKTPEEDLGLSERKKS